MNPEALQQSMNDHFRQSGGVGVLYLEGKDDPPTLAALLGLPEPATGSSFRHERILVVGLVEGNGSGATAVRQRVALAAQDSLRVQGIVDGDGLQLGDPLAAFLQAPVEGACWVWPTWSLDNLLAQSAWPARWGPAPDWQKELANYAPEVAWAHLARHGHIQLPGEGQPHPLTKFLVPTQGQWRDPMALATALDHWIQGEAPAERFRRLVEEHRRACLSSLEEAHARTNGKWLWKHYAPWKAPGRPTPHMALRSWREAVRAAGGSSLVQDWWARMAARFEDQSAA